MSQTPDLDQITTFTVAGVDVRSYLLDNSLRREYYAGGRRVIKCVLSDETDTLNISGFEDVVFAVEGTTELTGVVWSWDLRPIRDVDSQLTTREYTVTLVDMSFGLDGALINGTYGPARLSELLEIVAANANDFGITADPAQADYDSGDPELGVQSWEFLTLRQALDRLATQTGRVWLLDQSTLFLSIREPYSATLDGPRGFDEENTVSGSGILKDSLTITRSFDRYSNAVWLRYGPSAPALVTERFDGNGSAATFLLNYTFLQPNSYNTLTYFDGVDTGTQTVGVDGSGGLWNVDTAANTLTQLAGAIPVGGYVEIQYLANFPVYREFRDPIGYALYGPAAVVVSDPGVLTPSEAAAIGNGILLRDSGPYRIVRFRTMFGAGFSPLMTVTLNLPKLNVINTQFLISEIQVAEVAKRDLYGDASQVGFYSVWTFTCYEGLTIFDWLDELRGDPLPRGAAQIPQDVTTTGIESVATGLTCYPIGARGTDVVLNTTSAWAETAWIEVMPAASAPAVPYLFAGLSLESLAILKTTEIDVGFGADGSQIVVATFRFATNLSTTNAHLWLPIPYGPVAPSAPLWVRVRAASSLGGAPAADTFYVKAHYYASVPAGLTTTRATLKCWPLSTLTPISLPNTSWANGAYTQLVVTTGIYRWHIASITIGDAEGEFSASGDEVELDLAVGDSDSEVVVTTVRFHTETAFSAATWEFDPVLTDAVLPGQRVAIRGRHRRTTTMSDVDPVVHYYEGDL